MTLQQKILLVDDDQKNLEILSVILADIYEIQTTTSGMEALSVLDSFQPDIILLDIMMEGIDGYDVCQAVRSHTSLSHVKILLITAKTSLEDRLRGYEVGADDFISKPFEEEELLAKIKVFARLNKEEEKSKKLNRRLLLRQQDIPNILWECDNNLCFTWVENTAETILWHSPDQMLGQPLSNFLAAEETGEFYFKFRDDTQQPNQKIAGLQFNFLRADGQRVPLQVFADVILGADQKPAGMMGIFRDMGAFSKLADESDHSDQRMMIRIDKSCRLVHVDQNARRYLPAINEKPESGPDFLQYLVDPSASALFSFSFDQQEDIPFPVDIELIDDEGAEHHFSIHFSYNSEGPWQEGTLMPVSVGDQLDLVSKKMENQGKKIEDQKQALSNAVIIDSEMQESILTDAQNLAAEILDLVKSLEVFAFPDEGGFNLEEYSEFLFNRNLQIYNENLRLLGNKIHGLKGSCGFLAQPAKELCHRMEDLTRPLAENRLVFTESLSGMIKQFIYKIEDMLEQFEAQPESQLSLDNWQEKIDSAIKKAGIFISDQAADLDRLIRNRSVDNGEIRHRKKDEYLSVSLDGYKQLAEKVQELFYTLSTSLNSEELMEAGAVYNDFLSTHQQIKKVPLNLSRYERLIPKLAKEYEKEADFCFKDHQVKADREFWNGIHEILNHVLKNAIIHGIEMPAERVEAEKDPAGRISVELTEDALHIRLTVSDDGRGINTRKLAVKAVEDGILQVGQPEQMTEADILELLFLQGVSTADGLDDNAGRGVGMNAVQEATQQLQGKCRIITEPGRGCTCEFSFQKNNVSLACIIVSIDDLNLAFPEDYVESFIDYSEADIVSVKQKNCYQHNGGLIPLVDTGNIFQKEATGDSHRAASVMIIKNGGARQGLIINQILHHANLPILPLPKIYRDTSLYQGITIFNKDPVQLINVEGLN
ncbi:MAG: response regulator [Deltaproteobacteria bacterium]|nr:response regulator [Deltaproteobacteria bacterium]